MKAREARRSSRSPKRQRRLTRTRKSYQRRDQRASRRWNSFEKDANRRLKTFRQSTRLTVALTALVLWMFSGTNLTPAQDSPPQLDGTATKVVDPALSAAEATQTIRVLWLGLYELLPKILIALVILLFVFILARLLSRVFRHSLDRWEKATAVSALMRLGLYLGGLAAALSVIAGDVRALVGSVGLIGLALSWALQTPIESFTGWLLNCFHSYYRVGDRIEVGEVFGDVYRIDILTTTVWEAGGAGKPVTAAQATGALITFPNWEILRSNIVNYTRDFPYIWDEVTISLSNQTDLRFAAEVITQVARRVLGHRMEEPLQHYAELLKRQKMYVDLEDLPVAYFSTVDSWTNCTIRYLVHARERRRWASELLLSISEEIGKDAHRDRIFTGYPRNDVRILES